MTKAGEVTLHEVKLSDARELNAIFNSKGVNEHLHYPPSSLQNSVKYLKKEMKTHKNIVAIAGGKVVGNISIRPESGRSSHATSFGIMFGKSVHGKGVAAAALKEIFLFLKNNGFELVCARVHENNRRARSFYKKLGFKEVGTIAREVKFEDGRYTGSVVIVKYL